MANQFLQGIGLEVDQALQVRNEIFVITKHWYANRCPLVTRIPRVPVGSTTFSIINRNFRPRTTTLGAAIANNVVTTVTLADASLFMKGDVVAVGSERLEITADPDITNNTVTVRRGAESTTAAAANNASTVTLIGNSRTGAEIDQNGILLKPAALTQYCQVWQHPVQIGGSTQADAAFQTAPGVSTPFDQYKMDALQNLMDDMEYSSYYGIGEAPTGGVRPKQVGIKQQIAATVAGNVTTSPTNASAYKPTDWIRDTLQKCRSNGGQPDLMLVATNFMTGLATWSQYVQRIDAGRTEFGHEIQTFYASFMPGVTIVEAPLLPSGVAICLTSSEVRMRMKRNEFWNPRGNRGDATEGEFIAEGAIELDNPGHHAWVEGITTFSAT